MSSTEQLTFFPSLDFPGRRTVMLWEIAERLGLSERKVLNDYESGKLGACDFKGEGCSKRCIRVPVECYREYVLKSFSGDPAFVSTVLRRLPLALRRTLIRELQDSLAHA